MECKGKMKEVAASHTRSLAPIKNDHSRGTEWKRMKEGAVGAEGA